MIGNNYLVSVNDVGSPTITEPVSLEQARRWLDNPDSSYDETIEGLIIASRQRFESNYNMTICSREREFYYSDYGTELSLHYGPHQSVDTVEKYESDGTKTELTEGSDFSSYGSVYPLIRFQGYGKDIIITATSGMILIPDAIQKAVLMMVKYMFDGEWDELETIPKDIDALMKSYDKHVI